MVHKTRSIRPKKIGENWFDVQLLGGTLEEHCRQHSEQVRRNVCLCPGNDRCDLGNKGCHDDKGVEDTVDKR